MKSCLHISTHTWVVFVVDVVVVVVIFGVCVRVFLDV